MYNTKYLITYNSSDLFLETDINLSNSDKEFVIDALYRKDLCNIFSVDYDSFFEGTAFDKEIHELYKIVFNNSELLLIMSQLSKSFFDKDDKELGLMLLLSFEYLHLSHPCFCEYIDTGNINEDTIHKLKSYLGM